MDYTIYSATNPVGQVYVGITTLSLKERMKYHKDIFLHRPEKHSRVHKSFSRHGWDSHKWEVLDTLKGVSKVEGLDAESRWIGIYKDRGKSLNVTGGIMDVTDGELKRGKNSVKSDEFQKDYSVTRYKELKAQGICITCAKAKAMKGRVFCRMCAGKARDKEKRKRRRLMDEGRCYRCGTNLLDDSFLTCAPCRAKARERWRRNNPKGETTMAQRKKKAMTKKATTKAKTPTRKKVPRRTTANGQTQYEANIRAGVSAKERDAFKSAVASVGVTQQDALRDFITAVSKDPKVVKLVARKAA